MVMMVMMMVIWWWWWWWWRWWDHEPYPWSSFFPRATHSQSGAGADQVDSISNQMSYINPLCPSSARIAQIPSQTFYLFHPSPYQYYSSVVKHGILVILPPADAIYLIITIHKSHPQSQHPRGDPHPREEEGLIFNTQETISSVNPVIWIHIYRSQSLFYVVPRENWVSQTNRLKLSEILINHSNSNVFRSPVISVYFLFFAQFMQDLLHWFWILFAISPHFTQWVIYKKQVIHLMIQNDKICKKNYGY